MRTRREFMLAGGAGALGLAASSCWPGRRRWAAAEASRPRYYVFLHLSGGHDTVYTTDPKERSEVDPWVDLPSDNRIVESAGVRFGPHFAPLSRWASRLAFVNGVQVATANHDTGFSQFIRLKTNITAQFPTAPDLVALTRAEQPLGAVYLNVFHRVHHSPAFFGTADSFYFGARDLFAQLADSEPSDLLVLAETLRGHARTLEGLATRSREAATTGAYYGDVARFFERAATLPPLTLERRASDYVAQTMSDSFARAVWLLEHDLTCAVFIDLGLLGWDTHQQNESRQAELTGYFVTYFDWFLSELQARENRHGKLADGTVIVGGSDLGRFPRVNDMLGKDHLPQTSFFFAGPGIRTGQTYGQTNREMAGVPISLRTGRPESGGRIPILDDVGATVLRLAGLDPERYGYSGRTFDFLLS